MSDLPRDDYAYLRRRIPDRVLRGMHSSEEIHEYLSAKVSRRSVLKGIGLAGLAAAAGPILWSKPGWAAEPPRGIHLAYGSDPTRQMSVSWFTQANVAKPVVDAGPSAGYGLTVPAQSTTYPRAADYDGPMTIQHHATIEGLEPGKTYQYRVRHDGAQSENFSFTTATDKIEPFRFTAFGDQGIDPDTNAQRVTAGTKYSSVAVEAVAAMSGRFHVLAGDVSYASGVQDIWDTWAEDVQSSAAVTPWMVGLGNHEMEFGFGAQGYDPFRSRFRLPGNGVDWTPERTSTFYAFQHSNVLTIVLDGNEAASESGYTHNRGYWKGRQDVWLAATLKAGRANPSVDWIVVSFHNCMYCTDAVHGSDGGCRARWQKLFELYQVDVVLNGHNHTYERTYPIKGADHTTLVPMQPADPVAMGVTYLCVGGGGQAARAAPTYPQAFVFDESSTRQTETADWRAHRFDGHSLAVFDVDPGTPGGKTTLTLSTREFVSPARSEVDRLVLERPAKAILAGRVGGIVPTVPPVAKPRVKPVVKGRKELADTGIGVGSVAVGAAALGAAAAIARGLAGDSAP